MRLNAKQIMQAAGGQWIVEPIDASEVLTSITLDSRDVTEGALYVAIQGERSDGHDFVKSALSQGARAALITDPLPASCLTFARELGAAIIQVPSTPHAVADIAAEWRNHIQAKVIAITGSVGKTTTKNLTRDVLASKLKVCATRGNQNNELGGPLTLLACEPDDEALVMEMGMDGAGQIRDLCRMARPDWGVITNVGESHIEMLGSREAIANAKAELLEELPQGTGAAFLNSGDEYSPYLAQHARLDVRGISVCAYGELAGEPRFECSRQTWAEDVELDAEGRPHFTACFKGFRAHVPGEPTLFDMEPDIERASVTLALRGEHNVANALAAAAVGRAMGVSPDDIARALSGSVPEAGRQEILRAAGGFTVINDAYNASPDSMRASLAMLDAMDVRGHRVAVLGDMGELGSFSDACHEGVGEAVAASQTDRLICVGPSSRLIAKGAVASGMDEGKVTCVDTIALALEELEGTLFEQDVVLVKASNFMGLARLAEGLAS